MEKKVSVILPLYNVGSCLEACLASVSALRWPSLEILLIDDGSTDGTGALADRFAAADPRARCFHQKNAGVSAARNRGLELATGEYVLFVDGDDLVDAALAERTIPLMETDGADVLCFSVHKQTPDGRLLQSMEVVPGHFSLDTAARPAFILEHYLNWELLYNIFNKVYRRSMLEQAQVRFDEDVQVGEDMAFGIKVLLAARSVTAIPDVLYFYIDRENSVMNTGGNAQLRLDDFATALAAVRRCWLQAGCPEADFTALFIKTMDNQLRKRRTRGELCGPLRAVRQREFLRRELWRAVRRPAQFSRAFRGRGKYAASRWLDMLYCAWKLR